MAFQAPFLWIPLLLAASVAVSADSLMGGHLDNKEHPNPADGPSSRTDNLDLDLTPEESVPSPSALISDGVQFRMPGLFAFNGGKPFSLEKDPITGKIDFEKAPLKALNFTAERTNETDYDYDEEMSDVAPDDIFDKKNIDRKDGSIGGSRPNDINQYSPSFHDFLNLPVHYSPGKYSKEKYPLISSSYANTKVQSGLNSYSTYNHRPYTADTTSEPPLYFTTHKTYLPKTTTRSTTLTPTTTTPTTTTPMTTRATTPPSPPPTTTTKSTTTSTTTTKTTTTAQPTTTSTTTTTQRPTTTTTRKVPSVTTWKPSITFSTTTPSKPTTEADGGASLDDYEEIVPFKPMPESSNEKKPLFPNISASQNSHARPIVSSEYEETYEYEDAEENSEESSNPNDKLAYSSPTAAPFTTTMTTSTMGRPQMVNSKINTEQLNFKPKPSGFMDKPVNKPSVVYSQPGPSQPPVTSLPLGENHPQRPPQFYGIQSVTLNKSEMPGNNSPRPFENVQPNSVNPGSPDNNPVKVFERPILNNVRPDLSNRIFENANNNARPLVNPNGIRPVESTSNIIVPPGQDTVSFVLGNQQNVDGGLYVGSAMKESPYGTKSEGPFRPIYNTPNMELRPTQTNFVPNVQQADKVPVALPSIGNNPKPMIGSVINQNRPNFPNSIETQSYGFNPQNRPFPPKINGVEPPRPSPLPSFVNPPPPYLDAPALSQPSTLLTVGSNPVRIVNPQNLPSENSLNLGVRSSLNFVPGGSRPLNNNAMNPQQGQTESLANSESKPFSETPFNTVAPLQPNANDRIHDEGDEPHVAENANENIELTPQGGYVVFPGKNRDRPVEEHVIIVNEADGTVQELPPTMKDNGAAENHREPPQDGLPQLSENLTPPERPIERPGGSYPPRVYEGRPRPLYPPRSDYLRPPRLPPHSKPNGIEGGYKRPPPDSKLPNILPQFRPNAKASHGHHGPDTIGTIPAQYGPGRQPLGRRPPPQYLQRLSPPPPPIHALRLASDGDERFRESMRKDGQSFQDSSANNERFQGPHENVRFRNQDSENQRYPNSAPENERFQDSGPNNKRFRVPPAQNERFQNGAQEAQRFQSIPTTEGERFTGQKLRLDEKGESEDVAGFERFSAEPPRLLVNRRSGADYRDTPQVATLQMIQQQGGLDERVIQPNLPPPFRVKFNEDEDDDDEDSDAKNGKDEKRPVYVVYPVKSAVNIKDDSQDNDESVVVGTRGPQRPLPPDTLSAEQGDEEPTDAPVLPPRRDTPLLRPQYRPFSGPPMRSDFPYPLEKSDPSMLLSQEKPLLVPNDKIDEELDEKEDQLKKHEDTSINIIPYLQDYMPFPTRKPEVSILPAKPNGQENPWPFRDPESRIVSRPTDESPLYNAPISVTLKTIPPTPVTPIAYAYTPTADTPEYPKLGIRPSDRIEMSHDDPVSNESEQKPILPSQQPSSSSSSAPSPQNFMAPFLASVSAEGPSRNGWSVVAKPEPDDKDEADDKKDTDTQTETSEFDIENFKPQLFGGFKPIYEFPMDDDESVSKATEIPDRKEKKI